MGIGAGLTHKHSPWIEFALKSFHDPLPNLKASFSELTWELLDVIVRVLIVLIMILYRVAESFIERSDLARRLVRKIWVFLEGIFWDIYDSLIPLNKQFPNDSLILSSKSSFDDLLNEEDAEWVGRSVCIRLASFADSCSLIDLKYLAQHFDLSIAIEKGSVIQGVIAAGIYMYLRGKGSHCNVYHSARKVGTQTFGGIHCESQELDKDQDKSEEIRQVDLQRQPTPISALHL